MTKAQLIRTLWDLLNSHKACTNECSLHGELRNVTKAAEKGQIKRPYLSPKHTRIS
jgi:hypothetical protein